MTPDSEKSRLPWVLLECLIIGMAAVLALQEATEGVKGDHAVSRLATVYSLTQHGSWYIDNPHGATPNPFGPLTIDKVMVRGTISEGVIRDGRLISSKPPVLPLLMTGEYLVMNKLAGWDLESETDLPRIVFVMTLTLVGGAYVLALVFFAKTLTLLEIRPHVRIVLLVALAFGTQLWGFSGKLSNHVPAAGLFVVAVYLAVGLGSGKLPPSPWRFAVFGVTGALAATIDLPMGAFIGAAGAALLLRYPFKTLLWAGIGAGIPLAVPLPVQMRKETYFYENSYWRHPMGIDALNEPKAVYLFHILIGRAGIFSLYPVLLAGPAAILWALRRQCAPWRKTILAGGATTSLILVYYVARTNNYGGESYGFRWLIGAMPLLLLMGAPLVNRLKAAWHWVFLTILLAVSIYSGWECAQVDWESGREWTTHIFGPAYQQLSHK